MIFLKKGLTESINLDGFISPYVCIFIIISWIRPVKKFQPILSWSKVWSLTAELSQQYNYRMLQNLTKNYKHTCPKGEDKGDVPTHEPMEFAPRGGSNFGKFRRFLIGASTNRVDQFFDTFDPLPLVESFIT